MKSFAVEKFWHWQDLKHFHFYEWSKYDWKSKGLVAKAAGIISRTNVTYVVLSEGQLIFNICIYKNNYTN